MVGTVIMAREEGNYWIRERGDGDEKDGDFVPFTL